MMFLMRLLIVALLAFPMTCSVCWSEEKGVDFNRDIRPILSENCFHCHGPDANQRQADLRLDEESAARESLTPGDRNKSELYLRVHTNDSDLLMPPLDSNRKLTAEQIELLGQWIDQGAEWGGLWSWSPIVAPPVPAVRGWEHAPLRNPIDAFIQQRLQQTGLAPSPEASKRILIRRVSLDLTGLPPTPEEVTQFLEDQSPDAYELLVDRLLAKPNYGERMAWNWLDAARYADSNGYQGDMERTMWPWRDWVVDAFNENLPYDQFTIWQLAGDLLPDATFEQKLATGFCRNHMINGEGGRIPEENRVDYVMDMAETTGTVWLGLTLNCCRCHDHKFDPLSQKDYYSFFAFFNQTPVIGAGRSGQTAPILAAPTPQETQHIAKLKQTLADSRNALQARRQALLSTQPAWEARQRQELEKSFRWHPLVAEELKAEHQHLEQLEDLSIFATGPNPANDNYIVSAKVKPSTLTGIRIDALRHDSHTKGGLARSDSGNFVLTNLDVVLQQGETEVPLKIATAQATFEQGNLKVTNVFDANPKTGWAVYAGKPIDKEHSAVFQFAEPVTVPEGSVLRVTLSHDSQHQHHNLGRFLISVTDQPEPGLSDGDSSALQRALMTPVPQRTQEQQQLLIETMSQADAEYKQLSQRLKGDESRLKSAEGKVAKVMVMQDQSEDRQTYLLNRGLYNLPGQEVQAAVPESLPSVSTETAMNRLSLARWLVSEENPLTARVVVNRFWQQVFGVGLVKTANDFGVQGEIPKHLDLLNWLAADFRDSGWDVKRLIKFMVMSHAYRQSSKQTPELLEEDPDNRLLARAPRYRLPSWMIRDQALAVSGLLSRKIGGPSVNVYQPPGIWEEATFGKKQYIQDHGESLYRRSLYIFWRRIVGPTVFFDNAPRQTCSVKVFRTNTPLQALLTLNDVTYVEAARVLAERALKRNELSDRDKLDWIGELVLIRKFEPAERDVLLAGLQRTRLEFQVQPVQADELLSQGEAERDQSLDSVEHASWTALCLAILNLDETLTKE